MFEEVSPTGRKWIKIGIITLSIILAGLLYRGLFLTFVDTNELGYKYDKMTGELTLLEESGYYHVIPFVTSVHTIDLRPVQVCINANSRVLNCKLVRFNPKGFELFISWHGRGNYTIENNGNLAEILKSYAYDGSKDLEKAYPFIEIMKELSPEKLHEESLPISKSPVSTTIDTVKKDN